MMPSSTDAYNQLQDYSKTRKSAADIDNEAQSKYDISGVTGRVSQLRALTNNLSNSIDAVDPSVTGRTSGSLVTEAQRSALVNRERTPLVGQYTKTSADLGQSQGDLTQAQALAAQYSAGLRSDDETSYNRLLNNYQAAQAAEQAAEAKRQWEAQQAEQRRQFDAQQEAARASAAAAATGYNIGGGGAAPAAAAKKGNTGASGTQQDAYNAVKDLLNTKNKDVILRTIQAISQSASYGNAYDKAKLALIQGDLSPQFQKYIISNNSQLRF